MNITKLALVAGITISEIGIGGVFARADASTLWNWQYSSGSVTANGTFTTTDTSDSNGFYTITDITGNRNGVAINSLLPSSSFYGFPDNLLTLANPQLTTIKGFSYRTANNDNYWVYFNDRYGFSNYLEADYYSYRIVNFSATQAVPEPLTILGSLTALGFGMIFKRKK